MKAITYSILNMMFIVMHHQSEGCDFMSQKPDRLDLYQGASGTFFCYVKPQVDIRVLSLIKYQDKIMQLCFFDNAKNNLVSFSGTFENLQCEKSTCTINNTDVSNEDKHCSPTENSSKKSIYNRTKKFAFIWINNNYINRINFKGNILNLSLTLQGITPGDEGPYSCRGNDVTCGETQANSTKITTIKVSRNTRYTVVCSAIISSIIIIIIIIINTLVMLKMATESRGKDFSSGNSAVIRRSRHSGLCQMEKKRERPISEDISYPTTHRRLVRQPKAQEPQARGDIIEFEMQPEDHSQGPAQRQ
ncbi:uncharacterized protein LOC142665540 [Rhinoderma darwinii]|uniref:uncharacterized protein LOC142665540 n=1 Tax=Rhinoderma darwinii TaxID=43563 RepID=UPI003F66FF3B